MNDTRLYLDIHVLHDLPPSNINRDDAGTPKQARYGGVDRLRVSSQALKRAARTHLKDHSDPMDVGVRTRKVLGLLSKGLEEKGLGSEDAVELATAAMDALELRAGKSAENAQYLLFLGNAQVAAIIEILAANAETVLGAKTGDRKEIVADLGVSGALASGHSLDVALFGRMVADLASLNVDAATQVAHAVSTHAAQTQFDYFTAVDDLQADDETGAGMIGTVEFNSATIYKFATVGLHQLTENLGEPGEAARAAVKFVDSFVNSLPSGHVTSFAHVTRPGLVLAVLRADQPVNLVTAFERAVRPGQDGAMAPSQKSLAREFVNETSRWGDEPALVVASYSAPEADAPALEEAFGGSVPFKQLLEAVTAALQDRMGE